MHFPTGWLRPHPQGHVAWHVPDRQGRSSVSWKVLAWTFVLAWHPLDPRELQPELQRQVGGPRGGGARGTGASAGVAAGQWAAANRGAGWVWPDGCSARSPAPRRLARHGPARPDPLVRTRRGTTRTTATPAGTERPGRSGRTGSPRPALSGPGSSPPGSACPGARFAEPACTCTVNAERGAVARMVGSHLGPPGVRMGAASSEPRHT